MSVHRQGEGWKAKWREDGRQRSRTFARKRDAQAWDAEVRRRRQLGPLALQQLTDRGPTLGEWITERWAPEHGATLAESTRERYANAYAVHVAPYLDEVRLQDLTVARLRAWQAERLNAGVSPGTIHKCRTLLSSVLRHAAESEAILANAMTLVRPPKAEQRDAVRPLAPATVEAIRAAMLEPTEREVDASRPGQRRRGRYALPPLGDPRTRLRDATIVSLLAYAGLRPGEVCALRWRDIGEKTILTTASKTSTRRSVRLLAPLAQDLREYRLAAGRPAEKAFVLQRDDGGRWTKTDWQLWRRDRWSRACRAAGCGAPVPRPYDCRHSFASLLLAEGRPPLAVAQQLGHSTAVLLSTYAHLIAEFDDTPRIDAEAEIARARGGSCSLRVPSATDWNPSPPASGQQKTPR